MTVTAVRIKGMDLNGDQKALKLGTNLAITAGVLDTVADSNQQWKATQAVAKGDAVYFNATADEADIGAAGALATAKVRGLALETILAAATGAFISSGRIDGVGSGWTAGAPVYLSLTGTTRNTLTDTPPAGTDEVLQIIGYAINATDLQIDIQDPIEL